MSLPSFGDIDKVIKDLLSKDFVKDANKYTLKQKAKGPFSSKLTTTIDYLLGGSTSTAISAEYNTGTGFACDKLELDKKGQVNIETSLVGGPLPSGIKMEFKGDVSKKGELGCTYESDAFGFEASADLINFSDVGLSLTTAAGPAIVGASATVGAKGLSEYSVGASYSVPGTCTGAVVASDAFQKATVTLGYTGLADVAIGAQLDYPTNDIKVGGSYSCNKNTSMKVAAGTDGVIHTSVKHNLSPKCVVVGMLSLKNTEPSFGGNITLG